MHKAQHVSIITFRYEHLWKRPKSRFAQNSALRMIKYMRNAQTCKNQHFFGVIKNARAARAHDYLLPYAKNRDIRNFACFLSKFHEILHFFDMILIKTCGQLNGRGDVGHAI